MKVEDYERFVEAVRGGKMTTVICGLGLAEEAGEVAGLIKKEFGHDHSRVPAKVAKELGDTLWYLTAVAHDYGYSLADIMQMNYDKLCTRFPDGKFTSEASIARVDEVK